MGFWVQSTQKARPENAQVSDRKVFQDKEDYRIDKYLDVLTSTGTCCFLAVKKQYYYKHC